MTAKVSVKVPENSEKVIKVLVQELTTEGVWSDPKTVTELRSTSKPWCHYISKKKRYIIEEND